MVHILANTYKVVYYFAAFVNPDREFPEYQEAYMTIQLVAPDAEEVVRYFHAHHPGTRISTLYQIVAKDGKKTFVDVTDSVNVNP